MQYTKTGSGTDRFTICIVDDDPNIRTSLIDLFDSLEMPALSYASGDDFLARADLEKPGCILLDIYMPGVSGLEIQEHVMAVNSIASIVFMTGRATVPLSVHAMKRGACDFLQKPLNRDEVIVATNNAVSSNLRKRAEADERNQTLNCADRLTPREKEVMDYVVRGYPNKYIARELSVSEMMIKLHRSRMMKKMLVSSVPDLVRKVNLLAQEPVIFY